MSVVLPVPEQAASRQQIILDNIPYGLLLTWNERAGAWTLGLEDRDGAPVLYGRRIVLQVDLLFGRHHLPGIPAGSIFPLDKTGKLTGIGFDDLVLGRAVLLYYAAGEAFNGV